MPYNTLITQIEDILRVELTGGRVPDQAVSESIKVWSSVSGICHERGLHKILAVLRLTGIPSRWEAFSIGEHADKLKFEKDIRFAIVDYNKDSLPMNLFAKTVAANRGWVGEVFENEDDALKWLNLLDGPEPYE